MDGPFRWRLWAARNATNRAGLALWLCTNAEARRKLTPEDCCFRYLVNCPACGIRRSRRIAPAGSPAPADANSAIGIASNRRVKR